LIQAGDDEDDQPDEHGEEGGEGDLYPAIDLKQGGDADS